MVEHPILKVLEHYGWDGAHDEDVEHWQPVLCPFHPDTRSSASLSLEYDAFNCNGCGVKGNSVTLIMREEEMSYTAAKRYAEEILGGSLPEISRTTPRAQRRRVFGRPGSDSGSDQPVPARRRRKPFSGS